MQNVFTIDADIKLKMLINEPTVVQNDDIRFIINVFDDGQPLSLDSATTVSLASVRLDRQTVVTPGTKIGTNTVQFDLGTEETKLPGRVEATAQFYDSEGRVSTISFSYRVVKDPTGDGYIPSQREQTLIETVLNDGPLVIQQAQDAANFANEQGQFAQTQANAASEAAQNANDAARSATNAANEANRAADNANDAAEEANTQAIYAQTSGDYAQDKGGYAAQQGDYAKTQGDYAKVQGDYAKAQGDYAKQVGNENKTRWLTAVNTYADIATTYPNPQLGDTVQTINDSKIYRWNGTQWVWTQQYNANAITDVQNKIGILFNRMVSVSVKEFGAVADGITDDTSAIQNAINHISTSGGGTILLNENGTHLISSEIVIPTNVRIKGNNTILLSSQNFNAYMVRNSLFSASGHSGNSNIVIEGVIFDGNGYLLGGVGIAHSENIKIINCTFRNFAGIYHGIDIVACKNVNIKRNVFFDIEATMCQIDQATKGSLPTNLADTLNTDGTSCTSVIIEENIFLRGGIGAIHLHKNAHSFITITRNVFEDCQIAVVDDENYTTGHSHITISFNDIKLKGATTSGHGIVLHSGVNNLNIIGNQITPRGIGIILSNDSGREHIFVNIVNNQIRGGINSCIVCEKVKRANISNNLLFDFGDGINIYYGIKITDSDTFTIDGNFIGGYVSDYKRYGIYIESSDNFNISKNKLTYLDYGIYAVATSTRNIERAVITENLLNSMLNYGIFCIGLNSTNLMKQLTVSNNVIKTVKKTHGIRLQFCEKSIVCANHVYDIPSSNSAISLSTFKNGSVSNNVCYNPATTTSSYGIAVTGNNCGNTVIAANNLSNFETGIGVIAGADKCIVSNNVTIGCTNGVDLSGGVNNIQTNNITS